jgi:hypothetical protein
MRQISIAEALLKMVVYGLTLTKNKFILFHMAKALPHFLYGIYRHCQTLINNQDIKARQYKRRRICLWFQQETGRVVIF